MSRWLEAFRKTRFFDNPCPEKGDKGDKCLSPALGLNSEAKKTGKNDLSPLSPFPGEHIPKNADFAKGWGNPSPTSPANQEKQLNVVLPWRAKPEPEPAGEVDHGPIAQVLAFARRRALPSMAEPTELCHGCGKGLFWRLSVLSGGPSAWRCQWCDSPSPDAWIDAVAMPAR